MIGKFPLVNNLIYLYIYVLTVCTNSWWSWCGAAVV